MEAKPTSFLRQALNLKPVQQREVQHESIQQRDITPILKPVFRLLAQVEKTLDCQLQQTLAPLTRERATQEELKTALETLQALIPPNPEIQPNLKTQASNLRALYTLRDTAIKHVLLQNRHQFSQNTDAQNQAITATLHPFRLASRHLEVQLASSAGMVPGAPSEETDSRTIQSSKQTPLSVRSTVATCAQIALAQRIKPLNFSDPKNPSPDSEAQEPLNPPLTQQEHLELQKALLTIHTRRAELSPILRKRIEFLTESPAIEAGTLLTVSAIFRSLTPTPHSLARLEREEKLFSGSVQDVGTSIENLDGIHQSETQARRNLTELFDTFDLVKVPDSFVVPETPEALRLSLFQSIRKVAPTLGKTTTIIMVEKLAANNDWLSQYYQHGPDAILNADSYRHFVSISEPELTLFGNPSEPDQYLAETQNLRDTLTLINQAEGLMYTKEVYAAITHPHRDTVLELSKRISDDNLPLEQITPEYTREVYSHLANPDTDSLLQVAKRLFDENVPSEDETRHQLVKTLAITRHNATALHQAITQETEGALRSLETLPDELAKLEERNKVGASLVRMISLLSQRDVFSSLQKEIENQTALLSAQQDAETIDLVAQTNITERLATLQAIRDFTENPDDMDGDTYQRMILVVSHQHPPETTKERALITLLDHKTNDGLRVRTSEVLTKIEQDSGIPHLLTRLRSDLGVLRRFSEFLTVPNPQTPARLALSICNTPPNFKSHCKKDLISALKNTLAAHPWKNPASPKAEDIASTYTDYLAAKQAYKDDPGSANLLNSIQNLYKRTSEILKNTQGQLSQTNALALDLVSNDAGSLQALENKLLGAILDHPKPLPAIEFLASWENTLGNQTTLIHQNVSASDRPHRTSMPLVAARLQTKIENLLSISSHYQAIAEKPEALTETYIQFERSEHLNAELAKREPEAEVYRDVYFYTSITEPWEARMERALDKADLQITNLQSQLKEYENQYLHLYEPHQDARETDAPAQDTEAKRKDLSKLLGKHERRLRELLLKRQRLQEHKDLSMALNKANTPEQIKEALHTEPKAIRSLADAFDHAMRITPDTEKLDLPAIDIPQVTPIQMLEGAAIHQSLNRINELLKEAEKSLAHLTPALRDNQLANLNPLVASSELKKALFTHLKDIELQLFESGKTMDLNPVDIAEFIAENPELQTTQNQWIETLQKTQTQLTDTLNYVKALPPSQKLQVKDATPAHTRSERKQEAAQLAI